MSIFFKSPVDVEIQFDNEDTHPHIEIPNSFGETSHKVHPKVSLPLYEDGESISGLVTLRVREGRNLEHLGVKVAVVGSLDVSKSTAITSTITSSASPSTSTITNSSSSPSPYGVSTTSDPRKKTVDQFLYLSYDLCPAGDLQHSKTYPFAFKDINKRFESYRGTNVDVNYFIKVTVLRKSTDISKVKNFWVYLYKNPTDDDTLTHPVKLDIGIENCLHIEFEYSKPQYSLKEVIVGRIYFLLTRLRIKHMELSLLTRESSGLQGSSHLVDSRAIRYEVMDGSPINGESIPIRLFLTGYDLTPNMRCNHFQIKNYISLVIIDEDGRRYFKQSEITLYRSR